MNRSRGARSGSKRQGGAGLQSHPRQVGALRRRRFPGAQQTARGRIRARHGRKRSRTSCTAALRSCVPSFGVRRFSAALVKVPVTGVDSPLSNILQLRPRESGTSISSRVASWKSVSKIWRHCGHEPPDAFNQCRMTLLRRHEHRRKRCRFHHRPKRDIRIPDRR